MGLQALYGNELTGLCRPEELLRLLSCANRSRNSAIPPITSAMITDVPGYTWGVVPAFAHSGVKYFSIGPNGGDRIGHTSGGLGRQTVLVDRPQRHGPGAGLDDGHRLLPRLQFARTTCCSILGGWKSEAIPTTTCRCAIAWATTAHRMSILPDTVKQWNDRHAYPKLVIATTDEMFRDFEQRYGDKIPTAQGDFTPYWEDGAASSALETAMNRASAERLAQAETLFAMYNPKAYPAEDFYQAWRNVILYDEHTWGAHNSISQPDEPFVKSQWAIKRQFAVDADTPVPATAGRCGCQSRTRHSATAGQGDGDRRGQHHVLQLSLRPGRRAPRIVSGRRCRQGPSRQQVGDACPKD